MNDKYTIKLKILVLITKNISLYT